MDNPWPEARRGYLRGLYMKRVDDPHGDASFRALMRIGADGVAAMTDSEVLAQCTASERAHQIGASLGDAAAKTLDRIIAEAVGG